MLLMSLMGAELLMVVVSPHPLQVFQLAFFRQSILVVILLLGFLVVRTVLGSLVNNQLSLHRYCISKAREL